MGKAFAKIITQKLLKDYGSVSGNKQWMNPHIRYGDLVNHGYLILTLNKNRVQADYYHLKNRYKKNSPEKKVMTLFSGDRENRLQKVK